MDWNWSKFLGRPDAVVGLNVAEAAVRGKRVLITGAGGFIGCRLAEAALRGGPDSLLLSDSSEYALYEVYRKLSFSPGRCEIVPVLGDVLDTGFLRVILQQHSPDLIFHAAAYKHVPLLERNPFAAIRNNALGTFHLVQAIAERGGCDLILLSTDKAVEPRSIMGASKRIAELAVLAHRGGGVIMSALRLSNVLESSGSVVPLFAEQLQQGVALTVTHPSVRRSFLTCSEAAQALLLAASARFAGKVLVPESSDAVAILELARYMRERFAAGYQGGNGISIGSEIKIIGLKPGEKMIEKPVSSDEVLEHTLASGLRVFRSPCPEASELSGMLAALKQAANIFDEAAMYKAVKALVPEYASSLLQEETAVPSDGGRVLADS